MSLKPKYSALPTVAEFILKVDVETVAMTGLVPLPAYVPVIVGLTRIGTIKG